MALRKMLRRRVTAETLPDLRQPTPYYVSGNGSVEVEGRPHHHRQLVELVGHGAGRSHRRDIVVDLVCDPGHGEGAVSCSVAGRPIGHLPTPLTAGYSRALAVLETSGLIAKCHAVVVDDHADGHRLSVVLRLNEPEKLTVRNQPTGRTKTVLPCGTRRVVIVSDDRHTDALNRLASTIELDGGRCFLTLQTVGAGDVIEARLAGAPVGRMTPEMSARFLPIVAAAIRDGAQPWTEARIILPRRREQARFEVWVYLDPPSSVIDATRRISVSLDPPPSMVGAGCELSAYLDTEPVTAPRAVVSPVGTPPAVVPVVESPTTWIDSRPAVTAIA